jgi:hypothetical protein
MHRIAENPALDRKFRTLGLNAPYRFITASNEVLVAIPCSVPSENAAFRRSLERALSVQAGTDGNHGYPSPRGAYVNSNTPQSQERIRADFRCQWFFLEWPAIDFIARDMLIQNPKMHSIFNPVFSTSHPRLQTWLPISGVHC